MSEESRLERLEQEMMAMRPRRMPGALMEELEKEISRDERSDWFLAGAMGSGMAAAVVIAAILWAQSATEAPLPQQGQSALAAGSVLRAGDSLAMYARMDGNWDGVVK